MAKLIDLVHVLCFILPLYALGETHRLVIYEHVGRQGESLQLEVEKCTPFPRTSNWDDRVSSVDNKGKCITLHENGDCTGRYIELLPGDANQFDLYTAKFDDIASSASPCNKDYRGAFIEDGTYYIESAADASALTTEPLGAGKLISRVLLEDAVDLDKQRWTITRNLNSLRNNGYFLTAKVHHTNIVTTNVRTSGNTKNVWHFLPGLGDKYMIYRHTTLGGNICLVNRGFGNTVGESFCENNSRNQQWVLRAVDDVTK